MTMRKVHILSYEFNKRVLIGDFASSFKYVNARKLAMCV